MTAFELEVKDGIVKLEWGTWAMHRFCEMNGNMPISKLMEIYDGSVFTFKHVITMIQAASESAGNPVDERTAARWIDEAGGLQFSGSKVLDFVQYTIKCIIPELPAEKESSQEKKS